MTFERPKERETDPFGWDPAYEQGPALAGEPRYKGKHRKRHGMSAREIREVQSFVRWARQCRKTTPQKIKAVASGTGWPDGRIDYSVPRTLVSSGVPVILGLSRLPTHRKTL